MVSSARPVSRRPADLFPYFLAWQEKFGKSEISFFLDSFRAREGSRYSYFPLGPPEKVFTAFTLEDLPRAWQALQNELKQNAAPGGQIRRRGGPPFQGGAVGIISYDAGRFFEKGWRSSAAPDLLGFPLLHFGIYRELACMDHPERRLHFFAREKGCLKDLEARFQNLILPSASGVPEDSLPRGGRACPAPANRKWFLGAVKKIQRYIAKGDIYQANLSQRITRPLEGSGLEFFARLRAINPSPYACYFRLPASAGGSDKAGFEIVSCSPELLLNKRGGRLETRPIAGTRPRGKDARADKTLRGELLLSPKERAEHIMLVDLERNDLGRCCQAGSVAVTKKMAVEKYSHVMHIVSRVRGRIKKNLDLFDALGSVFPGGTITGCPKIRCMEILDAIEPVARGPFYGSAGWIGFEGDGDLNLLIRTALITNREAVIQVGSGIVADSDPEKEYEESLHKAQALLSAIQP